MENLLEKSIAIQSICSILPIITLLLSMTISCFQCSESAKQTGVLIHKIERDINNDLQNALVCLKKFLYKFNNILTQIRLESSHCKLFTNQLKCLQMDFSQ